jgi:hypothetical protein
MLFADEWWIYARRLGGMINDLPWQKPNSTEFFASSRLLQDSVNFHDNFVPYPWATWIDLKTQGKLQTYLPPEARSFSGVRATVCQHIWALEHLELFQRAGITDLFWSHATQGLTQIGGIRIHPFPLYPVRCATHPPTQPLLPPAQRSLLYSFQAAYAPGLYRTPVRDWLLALPSRPDAQLQRRREWHYEQVVYREQVQGQSADSTRHAQLAIEADAYAATLQSSCFALCPSGSGSNSIRLWEALGYGAIPVILSDQLQLPGSSALWKAAAVLVPETQAAVAGLPEQLEALASDHQRLTAMQQVGQLLWRRYGLDGFVGDVVDFLRDPLPVLRSRAQLSLPGDPVYITTTSPSELPLEVRRWLRKAPPNQPLLIVIQDQGDSELLRIRWQTTLHICSELIGDRPWSLASVSPALEMMG